MPLLPYDTLQIGISWAMLLLGWLTVAGGFTFEAWLARSRLTDLFDARVPADAHRSRTA